MEMNGKNQIYLFNIYFLSINFSQLRVVGCIFMAYGMARSGRNFFYFIGKKHPKNLSTHVVLHRLLINMISIQILISSISLTFNQRDQSTMDSIKDYEENLLRLEFRRCSEVWGCFWLTNHGILGEYKSSLGTCLSSIERPRIKVYPAYQRQLHPRRS